MKKSLLIIAALFIATCTFAQQNATNTSPAKTAKVQLQDYNGGGLHGNTIYVFKITQGFEAKEKWDEIMATLKSTKGINGIDINVARQSIWMDCNPAIFPTFESVIKEVLAKNNIIFEKGGYETQVKNIK